MTTTTTRRSLSAMLALGAIVFGSMGPAVADPCGMVPPPPPLEIATSSTIERIGVQKTFVAHDRGMETMVLRPGFRGNVDEFGMLIPFPSPPTVRKVDDNIFSHIAAAIEPPEVIARVQRFSRRRFAPSRMARGMGKSSAAPMAEERALSFDDVRVVRQEAVGMYEVATLAAGSPKALKRWMDDNSFRYPEGMDEVVADYVKSRWFFVAVKTKVGDKSGVNPRPGMRTANANRAAGTTFNGFVQAMGFRFKTKDLVVPMRLSVFNAAGNARNIVYALTDKPTKIQGIPADFVKRQIPGKRLYQNLTNPLPLRVIGGTKKDLNSFQMQSLAQRRDPTPHNGLAKELFGADMLAMKRARLSNPLEDKAKALLNIGESLGLRGRVIDDLNRAELKDERDKLAERSLSRLKGMTLTIIDGSFDRNLLAKQNLRFETHRMARAQNNKRNYDAIRQGPGVNLGGKLYLWEVAANDEPIFRNPWAREGSDAQSVKAAGFLSGSGGGGGGGLPLALFLSLGALVLVARQRRLLHPALVASALLLIGGNLSFAQNRQLVEELASESGELAVQRLAEAGDDSLESLVAVATLGDEPVAQGRAIMAMVEIGSSNADAQLAKMIQNGNHSPLLRTWAAAARMQIASSTADIFALEGLSRSLPATRRPFVKRLSALLVKGSAEDVLNTVARVPELQAEMQPALLALPSKALLDAMMSAPNQQARQRAAGLLGTKGPETGALIANALRFDKSASATPWSGGPLFMPSLKWKKKHAKAVANHLLRWLLWAEKQGDSQSMRVAANNLMSSQLAQAAGYSAAQGQLAYTSEYWLGVWTKQFGSKAVARIMKDLE